MLAIMLAGLAGCGFSLKGSQALPKGLPRAAVVAPIDSQLAPALERLLREVGVALVAPEQATAQFHILSEAAPARILTVGPEGRVREFRVEATARVRVVRSDGRETLLQDLASSRDFVYDPTRVLGKGIEQELVVEALFDELARQVLAQAERLPTQAPDTSDANQGA